MASNEHDNPRYVNLDDVLEAVKAITPTPRGWHTRIVELQHLMRAEVIEVLDNLPTVERVP